MTLSSKTALVTGGGTGIGLGIAKALAAAGCQVAIAGRRPEVLQEAVAASPNDPPMLCHTVDIADRDSVKQLFAWANEQLGKIDILVNSAGTNIRNRTMAEMTPEQWDQVMAINATGTYNCMYEVLPQMRERRDGLIINISSIAGKRASALGGTAYAASKFAMTALGTAVANEENKNGIRVTNVYPGEVDTPILENRPHPVSDEHRATILKPEDFGGLAVAIAALPPRAHVPEIIVKPTTQEYV
jgi:NAD(P)-dependent dehydrogenase (short-subunit alcohol dehydrogenase family)